MPKQTKEIRQTLRESWIKENGPCRHCRSWENLEVDHMDPRSKKIAKTSKIWFWADEKRRAQELAKCQPLCKKCHVIKTCKENGFHVFTDEEIREIRGLNKTGLGCDRLSRRFNCSPHRMRNILRGKIYKHVE